MLENNAKENDEHRFKIQSRMLMRMLEKNSEENVMVNAKEDGKCQTIMLNKNTEYWDYWRRMLADNAKEVWIVLVDDALVKENPHLINIRYP